MESNINFTEKVPVTGHLEIVKVDKRTGEETVLFDDHNVICSGLGQSVAEWMSYSGCEPETCLTDNTRFTVRPGGGSEELTTNADSNHQFFPNLVSQALIGGPGTEEYTQDGANLAFTESNLERFGVNSRDYSPTGDFDDDPRCCVGILDITATVTFSPGPTKTSINFEATVQVDTITYCDRDLPCTGNDPFGPTCEEEIERANKNFGNKPLIDGLDAGIYGGFNGQTVDFKFQEYKKLGCCDGECPDQSKSKIHTFTGTVPGGWQEINDLIRPRGEAYLGDFADQLKSSFGMSGREQPEFASCECAEEAPTER